MSLKNKVALITGGASGIGLSIAKKFLLSGAIVVVCGRKHNKLVAVKELLKNELSLEVMIKTGDITSELDRIELINFVMKLKNRIDILVNNAGVMDFANIENTSSEMLLRAFNVNAFAPFELMKKIYPIMQKQNGGNIINISSFAGLQPLAETSAYCASKAALQMLAQVFALEAAKYNVRINNICPDVIEGTELADHIFGKKNVAEKFYNPSRNLHPISRNGTVEDVANLALFLASEESSWMTGANVPLDGGRRLCTNRNSYTTN